MSNETMTLKVIAHIHTAFPASSASPAERAGGRPAGRDHLHPGIPQRRCPARAGGFQPHLAGVAILRCGAGELVSHRPAPAPGRQHPDGRVCHPLPLPAQPAGPFQRQAGGHRASPGGGPGAHRAGRRPDGRHPIYDIKPYIPYADCHPDAAAGFTAQTQTHKLQVECPPELWETVPAAERDGLQGVLENDPVPPTSTTRSGYTEWNFRDWKSILSLMVLF